ncbi:MAG: hypothetical protein FJ399_12035, partial [Verrucomicrobia bacterium]|nr:hypothetical protein [Verrucomicrobiota bacterium]
MPDLASDFCAILLVDPTGLIVADNAAARQWWRAGELVGRPFVSLFAFEVVSRDPDFLAAQWDGLLASGLGRPARLAAQPGDSSATCDVLVQLEEVSGGPGGYFATVRPAAAGRATAREAAEEGEAGSGMRLLTEQGGAGFFDLELK